MSKLNVQQLKKSPGFLKSFRADPGKQLVYTDFNSVEPHCLTYFSKDKRMLSLYGPTAKKNDIYLYVGAYTAQFGDIIRATGYDPESPTAEGLKAAKKECAVLRQEILKGLVLGCGYGLGAKTMYKNLTAKGVDVKIADCYQLHKDYWKFFAGVKVFEKQLMRMWNANGGFIINGRGRPICIDASYTKDIVNRFIQSTAHDCLVRYIWHLTKLIKERDIPAVPFMLDLHDSTTWQVEDSRVAELKQTFEDTYQILNDELDWSIKFAGDTKVGKTLAMTLE